ncbi:hypothetical protein CSKR_109530 [Clonorchis sinensis]|uniref:Uncharacterized protein n=1 Tax=Clonorchis sinensis TaxID=79923 RepID=A0A3R7FDI6_CLOSI|nr:hypothetical protein CSKR_109530 [Clonorchis sinensis]
MWKVSQCFSHPLLAVLCLSNSKLFKRCSSLEWFYNPGSVILVDLNHRKEYWIRASLLLELISSAYPTAVPGFELCGSNMRGERGTSNPPVNLKRQTCPNMTPSIGQMPVANAASRRRQNFQNVVAAYTLYTTSCTTVFDSVIHRGHVTKCTLVLTRDHLVSSALCPLQLLGDVTVNSFFTDAKPDVKQTTLFNSLYSKQTSLTDRQITVQQDEIYINVFDHIHLSI